MRAAVLAKGSALASRQRSRYSRRRAMPLAVKKRRERHQGAWPRTDNAAHPPERGERSLEDETMVWTATSTNFNSAVVPFGSESSTNHLVSQQKRIRRREAHGVGPARAGRLRNDFFHAPLSDWLSSRLIRQAPRCDRGPRAALRPRERPPAHLTTTPPSWRTVDCDSEIFHQS